MLLVLTIVFFDLEFFESCNLLFLIYLGIQKVIARAKPDEAKSSEGKSCKVEGCSPVVVSLNFKFTVVGSD